MSRAALLLLLVLAGCGAGGLLTVAELCPDAGAVDAGACPEDGGP